MMRCFAAWASHGLEVIRHEAAGQPSEALERDRRHGVAAEPLALVVVPGGDAHAGVQVPAVSVDWAAVDVDVDVDGDGDGDGDESAQRSPAHADGPAC